MFFIILLTFLFFYITYWIRIDNFLKLINFLISLILITFYVVFFKEIVNNHEILNNYWILWSFEEIIKLIWPISLFWLFLLIKNKQKEIWKDEDEKQIWFFVKILFLSALNFAYIENIFYFYNFLIEDNINSIVYWLRITLSSSWHLFLALFIWIQLEKRVNNNKQITTSFLLLLFVIVSILHGSYNYLLWEVWTTLFWIIFYFAFIIQFYIYRKKLFFNLVHNFKISKFSINYFLFIFISILSLLSFNSYSFSNHTYQNWYKLINDYLIIQENKEKIDFELIQWNDKEEKWKILLDYWISDKWYYFEKLINK